jgi:hypothetical protein
MRGEFFFMAIGGLGVSLAGFAGLIAALTPEQHRNSAVARWRIGRVVVWGLHATILGFGIVALFALLGNETLTARVASGVAALIFAIRSWRSSRPGLAWPDEPSRRYVMALWAFELAVVLGNVFVGSVGYLHAIMIVFLAEPAAVFIAAVMDATTGPPVSRPD